MEIGVSDGDGVGVGVALGVGAGVGHPDRLIADASGDAQSDSPDAGVNELGFGSELTNGTAMYCASVVPKTSFMPTSAGLLPSV